MNAAPPVRPSPDVEAMLRRLRSYRRRQSALRAAAAVGALGVIVGVGTMLNINGAADVFEVTSADGVAALDGASTSSSATPTSRAGVLSVEIAEPNQSVVPKAKTTPPPATNDTIVNTPKPQRLVTSVSNAIDDAEEAIGTGAVDLGSTDLELTFDSGTVDDRQIVGIRFTGVDVPPNSAIVSASVQFTTDETKGSQTELVIHAEAADDGTPFTATPRNISARPQTSAVVAWAPSAWLEQQDAGPDQLTPDLKTLVSEVVQRPGWKAGNALVFIISGSGARTAVAYEKAPSEAAILHIDFIPPKP